MKSSYTTARKSSFDSIPVIDRLICGILVDEAEKDIRRGYTNKNDCKFISSVVRNSIDTPEKLEKIEIYNEKYAKGPDRGCIRSDTSMTTSVSHPNFHDSSSFFEREKELNFAKSMTETELLKSPKMKHEKLDPAIIKRAERALKRREKKQTDEKEETYNIYAKPKPSRLELSIIQDSKSRLETITKNEEYLEKKSLEECGYKPLNPDMKLVMRARKRLAEKERKRTQSTIVTDKNSSFEYKFIPSEAPSYISSICSCIIK